MFTAFTFSPSRWAAESLLSPGSESGFLELGSGRGLQILQASKASPLSNSLFRWQCLTDACLCPNLGTIARLDRERRTQPAYVFLALAVRRQS